MRDVAEVLRAYNIFFWRNNTGRRGNVQYGLPGSPDYIGIVQGGKFLGVEVKAPGGKVSKEQKDFKAKCDYLGAHYIVVHSAEEMMLALLEIEQNGKENKNAIELKFVDFEDEV